MGTFQTAELIETFVNYHENIKKCVCLIYDPHRSQRGSLGLRAIRLKDSFINLFKQEKLSGKDLREANISWKDVFVDVPVKDSSGSKGTSLDISKPRSLQVTQAVCECAAQVQNSPLAQALVAELEHDNLATASDYDRLNLSVMPFMEKNIQSLIDCVDDLVSASEPQGIPGNDRDPHVYVLTCFVRIWGALEEASLSHAVQGNDTGRLCHTGMVLLMSCTRVTVATQVGEQQKVTMYHKNVARQAQQVAAWLQKRRQENQARRAADHKAGPYQKRHLACILDCSSGAFLGLCFLTKSFGPIRGPPRRLVMSNIMVSPPSRGFLRHFCNIHNSISGSKSGQLAPCWCNVDERVRSTRMTSSQCHAHGCGLQGMWKLRTHVCKHLQLSSHLPNSDAILFGRDGEAHGCSIERGAF
eukprot:1143089-Pelagomonas_calceolata.AAC.2